jgi:hypothetical protein
MITMTKQWSRWLASGIALLATAGCVDELLPGSDTRRTGTSEPGGQSAAGTTQAPASGTAGSPATATQAPSQSGTTSGTMPTGPGPGQPVAGSPATPTAGAGTSGVTPNGAAMLMLAALTPAQTSAYLRKLAPVVIARSLNTDEAKQLAAGGKAIEPIVQAWTKDPGFATVVRLFVEETLGVSGQSPTLNYDLPGNLAVTLVRTDAPWAQILTATTCYDGAGKAIPCDTGAPYTAGVLTTRAYMTSRASRFNLTRASTLLKNFACRSYPLEVDLEPHVQRQSLVPMFQVDTPEEQTVVEARNGFGNGFACYGCHGQFGAHAQLFVRYDEDGKWQAKATGIQDPKGELGRSTLGLMASHFRNPMQAAAETSQMFGKPVANLAEAAKVIVAHPAFLGCTSERFLDFVLGVPPGSIDYDARFIDSVAARAKLRAAEPSLGAIVTALLTEPTVVRSVLSGVQGAGI